MPGAGAPGWVLGDHLAALVPGPDTVTALDVLDPTGLDDDALIEALAAWERVLAWAAARQAALVATFLDREHSNRREEYAADAIAARLAITRTGAQTKTALALYLADQPELAHALTTGLIDTYKTTVLAEELHALPRQDRPDVLTGLLTHADQLTAPQLRHRVRKAAQAHDPAAAQKRAAQEADRRSARLTPAPDAMAFLTFYLPADDATTCYTTIDAIAATAAPDDPRPMDARRADALTDILRAILDTGRTPTGIDLPTQHHRRPHIQVTVPATTLLGLDETPADLAGYGPIPATMARTIAADGTWRRLLTDDHGTLTHRSETTYRPGADLTGLVIARDATCTFIGCRTPAWRCDLDHIAAFDHNRPATAQTTPENLQPLCRHHHRLKTHTDWTVTRDPDTAHTTWTTPWGRPHTRQAHQLPLADPHHRTTEPADPPEPGDPPDTNHADDPPPF